MKLLVKEAYSNLNAKGDIPDMFDLVTPKGKIVWTYVKIEQAKLDVDKWKCTDPSTDQWIKRISDNVFEVFENGEVTEVNLSLYTEVELEDYVRAFYDSLSDLREIYGEEANQVIAECIAEIEAI